MIVRNLGLFRTRRPRGDAPKDAHGRWCRLGVFMNLNLTLSKWRLRETRRRDAVFMLVRSLA